MNTATLTLTGSATHPVGESTYARTVRVIITPMPALHEPVRTLFPATSLARLWLVEPRGADRLRRAGERLGYGLIAAGGLVALGQLVVSAAEFASGWAVFARYVLHAVS